MDALIKAPAMTLHAELVAQHDWLDSDLCPIPILQCLGVIDKRVAQALKDSPQLRFVAGPGVVRSAGPGSAGPGYTWAVADAVAEHGLGDGTPVIRIPDHAAVPMLARRNAVRPGDAHTV